MLYILDMFGFGILLGVAWAFFSTLFTMFNNKPLPAKSAEKPYNPDA